jgi:hypothetical protein
MHFKVECYEHPMPFRQLWLNHQDAEDIYGTPLRLVHGFVVEADSAEGAAQVAWEIGNAPWEPTDYLGQKWDHTKVRSMSSGDVVVVETPDGHVGYLCLSIGWTTVEPWRLNIAN